MIAFIKGWILGLAAASIIAAVLIAISPAGRSRKVTAFASGFLIIAAMIKPVAGFDFSTFSSAVMQYGTMGEEYSALLEKENNRLYAAIIEERSSAYISDKAISLGMGKIKVRVKTQKGDGDYPYPYEVYVSADYSQSQKEGLSNYLESEFGVPVSRQYWSGADGD